MIICPDTQIDDAIKLSSKLREQFECYHFQAVERKTCSFGVTAYMEGDTLNTLVSRADHALYQAKDKGRNRVEYALT